MSLTNIAILLSLCFIGTFAQKCPTFKPQASFDATQYMGVWYEMYRNPNRFQSIGRCTNATYTLRNDGKVGVLNQEINSMGVYEKIEGYAVVKDPAVPASLEVTFGPGQVGAYNVLSTDYNNYSVVYSCANVPNTSIKIEFAWILSRRKSLLLETVNKAKSLLVGLGVDLTTLIPTIQDC